MSADLAKTIDAAFDQRETIGPSTKGAVRGDNHVQWAYRGGSGATTAVLVPVAWHIGVLAGYL